MWENTKPKSGIVFGGHSVGSNGKIMDYTTIGGRSRPFGLYRFVIGNTRNKQRGIINNHPFSALKEFSALRLEQNNCP
jgi:hypothetical protein